VVTYAFPPGYRENAEEEEDWMIFYFDVNVEVDEEDWMILYFDVNVEVDEDEDFSFIGSREPCVVIAGPMK
jgi:hypothetical protein